MEYVYLPLEQEKIQKKGWIEVVCGSMFSGKTEELIRRLKRAEFAKQDIVVFKPRLDVRYSVSEVKTHNGCAVDSHAVDRSSDMLKHAEHAQVVGVDEAQFFDSELPMVLSELANQGKRVIAAGLDMDYLGRPFGVMPNLIAMAEFVTKVHAICLHCGDLALHSHRTTKSKKLVELGETDIYQPLCRQCFVKARGQNVANLK